MYQELFSPGLSVDLPSLNLEVVLHYLQQWNLEAEQMQKGRFSATISSVHTPRIQLNDTIYSHGFMTRGEFPGNSIMIGYVKTNAKVVFQNRVLEINELVISTKGDEVDYISSAENEVFTITVEKKLFMQAFLDYFGEPFEIHQDKRRFFIKPHRLQFFLESINSWMTFLKANHHLLLSENKYDMAESEILRDIFSCLLIDQVLKERSGFKAEEARDLLHANVHERFDSVTLAKELGISQRQLQRVFKETYGISPKRYLLNLRINAVRKELLMADPRTATISSIALKYDFFDLNHFSKIYKTLFNELPSKTLHK
ncbi:AraC family transcriptional regulator [Sulfurovum sp. NBC37-1]|uniref:AraC family transcriptional regulator n=1 Tax=Sulfurovum sp. (strain NBC37-1) TaxID=387093 RepID=UPI0001587948|nr:helix-turn-helix domain-containing protein [Sulfurovum sp. NBC37-1]BAF72363.1 hypothetical protein SUN_1412 [Sulfurovum sp. NBC37-1]